MKTKIAVLSLAVVASLVCSAGAFAQGAAGSSPGGAASIPGAEVRAGESRTLNTNEGVTTGSSTLRPIDRDTAVTPSGKQVDTTVAPGGAVGRDAPDASAAAPAGR